MSDASINSFVSNDLHGHISGTCYKQLVQLVIEAKCQDKSLKLGIHLWFTYELTILLSFDRISEQPYQNICVCTSQNCMVFLEYLGCINIE